MKGSVIPRLFLVPLTLKMWLHDTETKLACQIHAFAGSPNSVPLSSLARVPFSQVAVKAV